MIEKSELSLKKDIEVLNGFLTKKEILSRIAEIAPSGIDGVKYVRSAMVEFLLNPELLQCDRKSILYAIFDCARVGLLPGSTLGHVYLIPFGKECKFVLGYKGMLELLHRHPKIESVYSDIVYENDIFEVNCGQVVNHVRSEIPPRMIAVEERKGCGGRDKKMRVSKIVDPSDIKAVYVRIVCSGHTTCAYMVKWEIDLARDNCVGRNSPAWKYYYGQMGCKTLIRRMFKFLPSTREINIAISAEDGIDSAKVRGDESIESVIDDSFGEEVKQKKTKSEMLADAISSGIDNENNVKEETLDVV